MTRPRSFDCRCCSLRFRTVEKVSTYSFGIFSDMAQPVLEVATNRRVRCKPGPCEMSAVSSYGGRRALPACPYGAGVWAGCGGPGDVRFAEPRDRKLTGARDTPAGENRSTYLFLPVLPQAQCLALRRRQRRRLRCRFRFRFRCGFVLLGGFRYRLGEDVFTARPRRVRGFAQRGHGGLLF